MQATYLALYAMPNVPVSLSEFCENLIYHQAGLGIFGIARQCQLCNLCITKGYQGLAQLGLSDNAKYAICVTPRVIKDLHNWHCHTMPFVNSERFSVNAAFNAMCGRPSVIGWLLLNEDDWRWIKMTNNEWRQLLTKEDNCSWMKTTVIEEDNSWWMKTTVNKGRQLFMREDNCYWIKTTINEWRRLKTKDNDCLWMKMTVIE